MKFVKNRILLIILPVILLIPVLMFFIYRPSRILFPELLGFIRIDDNIYIDNKDKMNEAKILFEQSLSDIENNFNVIKNKPRIIFCSAQDNFEIFGFKNSASRTIGILGIVLGPRAWKPYYIKHELIHYWQAENLGSLTMNFYPQWLIEGMAYSLSGDPRTLLDEPWNTYRNEFNDWYNKIDKANLLKEIKLLR